MHGQNLQKSVKNICLCIVKIYFELLKLHSKSLELVELC